VIDWNDCLAVRKEFRPSASHHLAREILARETLFRHFPEVPPILEVGKHYLISPYYSDTLRYSRRGFRLFPLDHAKAVVDVLERLYHAGYAVLDVHPENIVVDSVEGLKLIDFEFFIAYGDQKPPTFLDSWDVSGAPASFRGDRPAGGCPSWQSHWHRYVGLTIHEIRNDLLYKQHIKRLRHWAFVFLPRQLDHYLPDKAIEVKAVLAGLARLGAGAARTSLKKKKIE